MVDDFELKPRYSTREIPGRCIKCLAEQEYGNCLRELLKGREESEELEDRYEALLSFLKSPELQKLCDESERYLSEGKNVKVVLHLGEQEPKYEIKLD
jgi:hypothetical protein